MGQEGVQLMMLMDKQGTGFPGGRGAWQTSDHVPKERGGSTSCPVDEQIGGNPQIMRPAVCDVDGQTHNVKLNLHIMEIGLLIIRIGIKCFGKRLNPRSLCQ